jgi:hypothetical protein
MPVIGYVTVVIVLPVRREGLSEASVVAFGDQAGFYYASAGNTQPCNESA